MENQTTVVTDTITEKYKKIGNTMFKIVSYYSGKDTYEDIVKDAVKAEIEKFSS